jgi:hypothetical protein
MQYGKICFQWKHGTPTKEINLIGDKVIKLFIIRPINEWLLSMYHNPRHLIRETCCFNCFLTREQLSTSIPGGPCEMIDYKTKKTINYSDKGKTIFDIRNSRIRSYFKFIEDEKNIVFVNLHYLQNKDNCLHFIEELNKKYDFGIQNIVTEISHHIETGELNCKKKTYDIKLSENDICKINRYKSDKIEEWVDNLTFTMT